MIHIYKVVGKCKCDCCRDSNEFPLFCYNIKYAIKSDKSIPIVLCRNCMEKIGKILIKHDDFIDKLSVGDSDD